MCSFYGDCCADKVDVCDAPTLKSCGGFTIGPAPTCDADEYCHYEQNATCGWADAPGVCMVAPETCIDIFMPVCGCDGETYSNSCFANAAGTSVLEEGACPAPEPSLCLNESACGDGSFCDMTECNMPPCPQGMACPQVCHGLCAPDQATPSSLTIGAPVGPVAPDAEITGLSITADVLTIGVTYSGGCAQHDFDLFWAGSFLESFPVQAVLVLTHDAHGDLCKALISENVAFDLAPLRAVYQDGYGEGAATINLRVGSSSIAYTFGASEAAEGSCQATAGADDLCGGQGSASCWCDAACEGYGDCCTDKGVVCGME